MRTIVYSVSGMKGVHCVHAIRNEILRIPQIQDVSFDLLAKTVAVTGQITDDAAVHKAIREAGYKIIGRPAA